MHHALCKQIYAAHVTQSIGGNVWGESEQERCEPGYFLAAANSVC